MRDHEEDMDERRAAFANVEIDDTSLALAWIAIEMGSDEDPELVRASDGLIRRFDQEIGMWAVINETSANRRLSDFLCDIGDAKLEAAEVKLREGEIETKEHSAVKKLRANLRSQTRFNAVWQKVMVHLDTVEVDAFDADPEMLGTPGGVVDLKTGAIRAPTVGDKVTQRAAVSPAPDETPAPTWEKFLCDVFEQDFDTIGFIQRVFGSALVGDVSPQKFVVLYGNGANGKSVLRDVLGRLAGSYAAVASAKVFMQSRSDRHPTEIASLEGKRIVLASEVPTGRSWNDTLLKDLTGGEKMTARRMHKDEFSFTPCGTVIFTANTLPSFPGAQDAMLRRILLVPMSRQFSEAEQDPNLAIKLFEEEGPAILTWMIEGARKFLADGGGVKGLRTPKSITDATRVYFEEEDIVLQFLRDAQSSPANRNNWTQGAFVSNSDLLAEFNYWAGLNGHTVWSVRTLAKAIRENPDRYGMSDKRMNAARGFQVERLLASPAKPEEAHRLGKLAKRPTIQHHRAVGDGKKSGDRKGDR